MNRHLCLFARAVMIAIGVGAAALATEARAAGDTLMIGVAQFPPDLHPDFIATDAKLYLLQLGQRPLTQFDPAGNVVCRLCVTVPSLANGAVALEPDGGMTTRWTLRDDLFWADGVKVTTRDAEFAFAVGHAIDPGNAMDRIDIVDARSFIVHRNARRYDFDVEALPGSSFLLPEHVEGPVWREAATPLEYSQHSLYNRAPGTPGLWLGPYRLTRVDPAGAAYAEPNAYWAAGKLPYREIAVRLIERTPALEANLLAGDIDVMAELAVPLSQMIALARAHADRFDVVFRASTSSVEHLAVALGVKPLDDRRVRQAILMGIDRQAMATKLFEGKEEVADELVSPESAVYDPTARKYPYDPQAAKKLLREAGFTPGPDGILVGAEGRRLSIPITTTAGNALRELEEVVMQSQLKAIGVELTVKNEPARTMFGQTLRERKFDGFVLYTRTPVPNAVPWGFLGSRYIPSAANGYFGTNYSGYANPEMDAALDAARGELDPLKRRDDWRRIHALVAEDLPILPLFQWTIAFTQSKAMQGILPPRYGASATSWVEDWRPR